MRRTGRLVGLLGLSAALFALGGAAGATSSANAEPALVSAPRLADRSAGKGAPQSSAASLAHALRGFVTVPRVAGLPVEEAFRRLRDAGLRVRTSDRVRLGPTNGLPGVFRQSPREGNRVRAGTVVTLSFCGFAGGIIHPTFDEVVAPDVTGLSLREALASLEGSPVVWSAMLPPLPAMSASSFLDAYRVTGQTPKAGTRFVQTVQRTSKRAIRFDWTLLELKLTH
jgi:hypothetical protein